MILEQALKISDSKLWHLLKAGDDGGFYFHGEPLGIGGHVSLRIMHSFDPYDELSEPEKQYILGLQCNLWAEYISDFSHVQFMVLPRFCALSENAWSEGKTDYDSFLRRVEKGMLPLYRYFGFNVADYAFNGIE